MDFSTFMGAVASVALSHDKGCDCIVCRVASHRATAEAVKRLYLMMHRSWGATNQGIRASQRGQSVTLDGLDIIGAAGKQMGDAAANYLDEERTVPGLLRQILDKS